MRKIAFKGMRGRRKDAAYLIGVIALSLLFMTVATQLLSSISETDRQQNFNVFGEWKGALLSATGEEMEALRAGSGELNAQIAESRIIGESKEIGVIGVMNEKLMKTGRFKMYEGRMPETENEVAIEMSRLGEIGGDINVGDEINVYFTAKLPTGEERTYDEYHLDAVWSYVEQLHGPIKDEDIDNFREIFNQSDISVRYSYESEYLDNLEQQGRDAIADALKMFFIMQYTGRDYYFDAVWSQIVKERGPITDEDVENFREILKDSDNTDYYDSVYLDQLEDLGRDAIIGELKRFFARNYSGGSISWEEISWDSYISSGEWATYNYGKLDPIIYEDINLNVETSYYCLFNRNDVGKTDTDAIMRDGFIDYRTVTVKRKYKITGIIQSYSDRWDAGDYQVPNAYINEADLNMLDAAYDSMIERLKYDFRMPHEYNAFLRTDTLGVKELFAKTANIVWPEDQTDWAALADVGSQKGEMRLRMNPLAYPTGMGQTEDALIKGILFGIFLITVCAVFQILFTQLKRRNKRIALLKAVGASNAQVARMLLWECGFVLVISLPVGLILGGLLAYGAVWAFNAFGGGSLTFALDFEAILLGVALSCASVFLGMAVPLIKAMRVSPIQGIREPGKGKLKRVKSKPKERQTFAAVCRRNRAAQRGKNALSLGLSTFTAIILLTALTLSYLSFGEYTDKEEYENAPDYLLWLNYGIAGREIDQRIAEMEKITGVGKINALKKAERLYISFDGMDKSPSLNKLKEILPERTLYEHFGGKRVERSGRNRGELIDEPETEGTYIADLYGVDVDSVIYEKLLNSLTAGSVNERQFKAGKEAILLVPLYMEGGDFEAAPSGVEVPEKYKKEERMRALLEEHDVLSITTDKRKSGYYKNESAIKPGESLHITVCRENIVDEVLKYYYYEHDIEISGVIYYFPDEAIWPFSQYREGYTLIGSYELVNTVYPLASGGRYDKWEMQSMSYAQELYYPTLYGQTLFAVYGNEQANREETDLGLLSFSKKNDYTFYNYKDMNREIYAAALNTTVIICLLGLAGTLIACVILYNTEESAVNQDRNRIGVLQSMGVTENELRRWKWKTGLANGLIALAIANAFVFCVVLLTSVVETGGMELTFAQRMTDIIQYRLSMYPWAAHVGLCAAYLISTMLIHRIPIRTATKYTPIENIRS